MKKIIKNILFILFLSINIKTNPIDHNKFVESPKIILVDIGGTLIEETNLETLEHFGTRNILGYFFTGHFNLKDNMKTLYIDTLSKIPSKHATLNCSSRAINGRPMPPLQFDYLSGKITQREAMKIVDDWMRGNPREFKSEREKKLFKKIFEFNFEAEIFMKYKKFTKCMDLIKKLFEMKDGNGKRKNIIVIISNQSKEHLYYLKRDYPQIFQFTDAQVFSCEEGLVKPNQKLFEKCISLCPEKSHKRCFLIDDEDWILESASKFRIKDFVICGMYPNAAEKILKEFSVI